MFFYGSIILVTTFLSYLYSLSKGKKIKISLFFLLVLFPSLISGLRGVGTDYHILIDNFDKVVNGHFYLVDYDSLWIQIVLLFGKPGIPPQVPIFLASLITICGMLKIFRSYEKNISFVFSVFSFMCTFYLISFNLYRQLLSNVIFLLGVCSYAQTAKSKKYWLYGIISVLIHDSNILFLPMILFWKILTHKRELRKRLGIYICASCMIISIPLFVAVLSNLVSLFPHYAYYFEHFYFKGFGLGIVRYFFLTIIPVIYITNLNLNKIGLGFLPFFCIFGTVIWLSSYISESFIYRLSYTLHLSLPILYGVIAKEIKKRNGLFFKRNGIFLQFLIISMLVICCYNDFIVVNSGLITPYHFFWE